MVHLQTMVDRQDCKNLRFLAISKGKIDYSLNIIIRQLEECLESKIQEFNMTTTTSKLERVLEHMINDETDIARDLLHEHIIETAREVYADLAEQDSEIGESYDLDEVIHTDDESGDFGDDIKSMKDEIQSEEYFNEDDDEESLSDLEAEMGVDDGMGDEEGGGDLDAGDFSANLDAGDGDMAADMDPEAGMEPVDGGDMDADMDVAAGGAEEKAEEALDMVNDAMEMLTAAFADLIGDSSEDEADAMSDMDVSDEFNTDGDIGDGEVGDPEGMGDEEGIVDDEGLGEAAKLSKVSQKADKGTGDSEKSPILQKTNEKMKVDAKHAAPIKTGGGSEESGQSTPSSTGFPKVKGPQEAGSKPHKNVKKPANKPEKGKSLIGS